MQHHMDVACLATGAISSTQTKEIDLVVMAISSGNEGDNQIVISIKVG